MFEKLLSIAYDVDGIVATGEKAELLILQLSPSMESQWRHNLLSNLIFSYCSHLHSIKVALVHTTYRLVKE
jgi:hypothetical protein